MVYESDLVVRARRIIGTLITVQSVECAETVALDVHDHIRLRQHQIGAVTCRQSFASKPHARTGCSGADGAFGGSARDEVDPLERPIRPVEPCADRSPERFVQVGVGSAHPRPGPHVHPVAG